MKKQGEEVFNQYFSEVYGDRWGKLKEALLKDETKVARCNRFYDQEPHFKTFDSSHGIGELRNDVVDCYEVLSNFDLGQFSTQLLPFYRMDPASLYPALALQAQPGETVLDMCAAPGGKSLVILEDMKGKGKFVANELSAKRRFRMMSVFKRYVPHEIRRSIRIRGVDASRIGLEQKLHFDRILLDAPCSGERGMMKKSSELAKWKPKRGKSFGIRQYALLSSAFMALKPGGRIVYSTCSISPEENDNVIQKLFKRHEGKFKILDSHLAGGESTDHGKIFLPDRSEGWGPIYYSIIEKNKETI